MPRKLKQVKNEKIKAKNGRKKLIGQMGLKVKKGVAAQKGKQEKQTTKTIKRSEKINLDVRVKKAKSKYTSIASLSKMGSANIEAMANKRTQTPRLDLRQTKSKKFKHIVISADMSRLERPGENKPFSKLKIKKKKSIIMRKIKEYWLKKEYKFKAAKAQRLVDPLRVEWDKHLIMWGGVIFFMVLIVFFWTLNIKRVFTQTGKQNASNSSLSQWSEITGEFSKTIKQVKQGLSEIKSETADGRRQTAETGEASVNNALSENQGVNLSEDKIIELKERLEELESALDNSKQ